MTVLDAQGNPLYNRRVRPHGTAGQKAQWKQNKYRQPPHPKYLFYSKTFNCDSKFRLWWSTGVSYRNQPLTQTTLKQAIWDAKQKRKKERRQAKRKPTL